MTDHEPEADGATNGTTGATRARVEAMLLEGKGTPSIAAELGVSRRRVRHHTTAIRRRWAEEENAELAGKRAEVIRHVRRLAFKLEAEGATEAAARAWVQAGRLLGLGGSPTLNLAAAGVVTGDVGEGARALLAQARAVLQTGTIAHLLGPEESLRLADQLAAMAKGAGPAPAVAKALLCRDSQQRLAASLDELDATPEPGGGHPPEVVKALLSPGSMKRSLEMIRAESAKPEPE